MQKIQEIFGLVKTKGQFGIEVEVEGEGLQYLEPSPKQPWQTVPDGSLRGNYPHSCCEYVLSKPVLYGRVPYALEILKKALDDAGKVNFSFRTSVHVHYNIQDFTAVQAMNMMYAYTLVESAMLSFCGNGRQNNRFCLRVRDAEGIIPVLQYCFATELAGLDRFNENNIRYSSLNLAAIRKYGSIEFRGMEGTGDPDRLMTWITAINDIGEYAKEVESPSAIYNDYVDSKSKKEFFKKVLKNTWKDFYREGLDGEVDLSFSLSLDLPFTYAAAQKKREAVLEKNKAIKIPDMRNLVFRQNPAGEGLVPEWRVRNPAEFMVVDDIA